MLKLGSIPNLMWERRPAVRFLSLFLSCPYKKQKEKKAELGFVIRILKFVLFSLLLPKQFIELCKSWEIQKSQKKMNISGKGGNF